MNKFSLCKWQQLQQIDGRRQILQFLSILAIFDLPVEPKLCLLRSVVPNSSTSSSFTDSFFTKENLGILSPT